jgi:ATP-dependent protease ClpP protease subunit
MRRVPLDLVALIAEGRRLRDTTPELKPEELRPQFTITAEAADTARLDIMGSIGGWFGVSAEEIVGELRKITAARIKVYLNSRGGDVFDGLAIYNALRDHPAQVESVVLGNASSIASVIALAGNPVSFYDTASMLIHNPHAIALGGSSEMRRMAEVLDKMGDVLTDVYVKRTKQPRGQIRDWMTEEHLFTAHEAKDFGFADAILTGKPEMVPDAAPAPAASVPAPPTPPGPGIVIPLAPRRREAAALLARSARLLVGL